MIEFKDGKVLNAFPFFEGLFCTIYDSEPNTSGFCVDGFDCSDYRFLFRQGDSYYQLTNDESILGMNPEDVRVPDKTEIDALHDEVNISKQITPLEEKLQKKKDELSSTDYIIVKMAEGVDISEYDIEQIKADRQQLRDEINEIEEQISRINQQQVIAGGIR